jgi:hypothetical protein
VDLDYRCYARFDMLAPSVLRPAGGRRLVRPMPGLQPGDEEYQFCKLFVVEAGIRLAEVDFDLDIEGLWPEQQRKLQ